MTDEAKHDKPSELIETMLKLHKDLPKAKPQHEQEFLQCTFTAADKKIDGLACEPCR